MSGQGPKGRHSSKEYYQYLFIFFYLIDKKRCKQYSYSYICRSPHVGAIYHFPRFNEELAMNLT